MGTPSFSPHNIPMRWPQLSLFTHENTGGQRVE